MENEKKLKKSFCTALSISENVVNEKLEYNGIPEWDSIGHMSLISSIEEEFKISIETDDIIDFSGYKKGKEILSQKYNVKF
jgi:acyl carrier protein|tara:strand:+ start:234 stop:476 length:243 start_codon:yes stop_codon:yes gene_type:complete